MTTTITKSVGSASRDYATLALAWAALPTSLVTADQAWILELYNDSEFTPGSLYFTGKATDATRNIIIRCATGQSFRDNAGKLTNPLIYDATKGVGVSISGGSDPLFSFDVDYLTLDGLQVNGGSLGCMKQTTTASHLVIKNCILSCAHSGGNGITNLHDATVINCLGIQAADGHGFVNNAGGSQFHNCTAVKTGTETGSHYGFSNNYSTPLVKDCAAFGFATAFRSGLDSASDYNAGDTTVPGTHSLSSLTFANQFVSTTADFRVKAGAGLISAGTRDQTYTSDLDIVGSARSTTAPTIGAWEYAAGGGTAPTLTTPIGAQTGTTTASGGVTTDTAAGTLYAVCAVSGGTAPSVAQVKAGQDSSGAAASYASNQVVTTTGAKTVAATGLTASTAYKWYFVHTSGTDSLVSASAPFATAAVASIHATITLTSDGTTPRASLSALKWAWFDQVTPDLFTAVPTDKGSAGTTNGSGVFDVILTGTAKAAGGVGFLIITDSDGTPGQTPSAKAFAGPVTLS